MCINLKPNKHKIISFNATTMTSLGFIIVATFPSPHPSPLLKGGGGWGRVQIFCSKGGDKTVKGGGLM